MRGAAVVADWCHRFALPISYVPIAHLTDPDVKGITFHMDCEKAEPSTGHTDPGNGFPQDTFLSLVGAAYGGGKTTAPQKVFNPYPAPDYLHHPIYRGGLGSPVQWVQWALRLPTTGKWDALTENAVKACQRRWSITPVDGVVGKVTGSLLARFYR